MADDGMLVNFDIGEGFVNAKPTFKGGTWKDRLSAKKASVRGRAKPARTADAAEDGESLRAQDGSRPLQNDLSRPVKRQRMEGKDSAAPTSGAGGVANGNPARPIKASSQPHQVVSSLFSFNPKPTSASDEISEAPEKAEPSNAPSTSPLDTFTSLGISVSLAEHLLNKLQITAPTAIQKAAVSQLLREDTDAFIQAETGSGKTLAYLLPIVQKIMAVSAAKDTTLPGGKDQSVDRGSGLFAIIIAPTRELSKQIYVVLESLLRCAHWIVAGTVIGGEKKKSEKARLRKGLNILIATPGRLADHLDNTKVLDVRNVRWLVLDEGDRLMELGFEADIEKILSKLAANASGRTSVEGLPHKRTTVLCSATMKMTVQKLGEMSLKDAVHIQANLSEEEELRDDTTRTFSAPAQLRQSYAVVPAKLRLVCLTSVLKRAFARRGSVMKTIVFLSCADSVDFHFEVFTRGEKPSGRSEKVEVASPETTKTSDAALTTSLPATSLSTKENAVQLFKLHGSLPQSLRTSTVSAFSRCKTSAVMVCTDVASRGLDLPNVDFVIEYDPPFSKDDHLHRIGRTARAGKEGRAMIFLLPGNEERYVDILKEGIHDGGRNVTRHDCEDLLKKAFASPGLGGDKDWEDKATDWQLDAERWALDNPSKLEQARRAYQSHVRAYATHVATERHMFDITSLHLGHLAKAFALRDKPGSIKVPGLRPSQSSANAIRLERKAQAASSKGSQRKPPTEGNDGSDHSNIDDVARQMRHKSRTQLSGASEFNLG